MINVHSPVKRGSIVKQDYQYDISGLMVRGGATVSVMARSAQSGEEISSGVEVDFPSLIELCKRVLVESGTLPKWFFFGVIIDAPQSQIMTYFSPHKEKFFSDIYQYIKTNLAGNLPFEETETVVKNFFEHNRDFHFHYMIIPLDSLIAGSGGGSMESNDIRF